MTELWQGLIRAIELIVTLDPEVMEITRRSLLIAVTSCSIASLLWLPLGSIIHFNKFPGKRFLINLIQTLYSIPTVAVGLFVFVFISSAGPFGFLNILFTPVAMVVGQAILITPIILGLLSPHSMVWIEPSRRLPSRLVQPGLKQPCLFIRRRDSR